MGWTLEELEERLLIGSTLVEGSTLSEEEAHQILRGRTVAGHPVREARELLNYRAATGWLLEKLTESPFVSLDLVIEYHHRLMQGLSDEAGRLKTRANYTLLADGSRSDYLHPAKVEEALRAWIDAFNHRAFPDWRDAAAELYASFQQIHPFEDGNGRVGRILLAYWLHWKQRLSFHFTAQDKLEHLRALEASDRGDLKPLADFLVLRCKLEA